MGRTIAISIGFNCTLALTNMVPPLLGPSYVLCIITIVLTVANYEAALAHLDRRPPTESRPMILLVDVDSDLDLTPPHSPGSYSARQAASRTSSLRNGHLGVSADQRPQGNGQRHLRATSDSTLPNGTRNHSSRHGQNGHAKRNGVKGASSGQEFLECILQNVANGTLHHVVPVGESFIVAFCCRCCQGRNKAVAQDQEKG